MSKGVFSLNSQPSDKAKLRALNDCRTYDNQENYPYNLAVDQLNYSHK